MRGPSGAGAELWRAGDVMAASCLVRGRAWGSSAADRRRPGTLLMLVWGEGWSGAPWPPWLGVALEGSSSLGVAVGGVPGLGV